MYSRLYVHIPFCTSKCSYCAFISSPPAPGELDEYPSLLAAELERAPRPNQPLDSVYFGGGTPSLLSPPVLERFLQIAAKLCGIDADAEITIEANPGTIDESSLRAFHDRGINRISIGVQSLDDHYLRLLGRAHTAAQADSACKSARRAGFKSISIDLIHSLPGQTLAEWRNELQLAMTLEPDHFSLYGLTVEPETPMASRCRHDGDLILPDEDLSADMIELAKELLLDRGYEQYEIASYARPGFRSRHNCGYWQRDGYLGLGVAAHSFMRIGYGVRYNNPITLDEYRAALATKCDKTLDRQVLTKNQAISEFIYLGLRMADGIDLRRFESEFNTPLRTLFATSIPPLMEAGLTVFKGERLALTERGMFLSNTVLANFILPDES